jgi:hypothetical protein
MGWYKMDLSDSGWGPVEESCEHGNEPLVSLLASLLFFFFFVLSTLSTLTCGYPLP